MPWRWAASASMSGHRVQVQRGHVDLRVQAQVGSLGQAVGAVGGAVGALGRPGEDFPAGAGHCHGQCVVDPAAA